MSKAWRLPCLLLIFASTSCQLGLRAGPERCRGEFTFSAIADPGLRRDARHTIIQFADLDPNVSVELPDSGDESVLLIHGLEGQCRQFGDSFLGSEMPEFRGLVYRDLR